MSLFLEQANIEIPFRFRHNCWFCGEPKQSVYEFPAKSEWALLCEHPRLHIPACAECGPRLKKSQAFSIWQCRQEVKSYLCQRYQKDLAIGKNWSEEELATSGFEGGNFAGFAKSAWMMFEIARDRVNFKGWPLVYDGEEIHNTQAGKAFLFDGIEYVNLEHAVNFYVATFDLDKAFFIKVLTVLGPEKFAQTIRFCRLYVGHTPNEKRMALTTLSATEQ
ncbi:hypothetical protein [Thalassotalea aquiviva]|uniref:hypothetical protein n=1 Tax=Thalassotalea aquiviva TaxID=3242415 RepID=UPI00352A7481